MLYYVVWNLFTVGNLQFCSDGRIVSLEANQKRPKYNVMETNKTNFCILCTLKFKTIILICVHTKTSKFHKPSVG